MPFCPSWLISLFEYISPLIVALRVINLHLNYSTRYYEIFHLYLSGHCQRHLWRNPWLSSNYLAKSMPLGWWRKLRVDTSRVKSFGLQLLCFQIGVVSNGLTELFKNNACCFLSALKQNVVKERVDSIDITSCHKLYSNSTNDSYDLINLLK